MLVARLTVECHTFLNHPFYKHNTHKPLRTMPTPSSLILVGKLLISSILIITNYILYQGLSTGNFHSKILETHELSLLFITFFRSHSVNMHSAFFFSCVYIPATLWYTKPTCNESQFQFKRYGKQTGHTA